MPDMHQPPSEPDDPDTVEETEATSDEPVADDPVVPVVDRSGQELGEISGGGEVTDLGGDSPSS